MDYIEALAEAWASFDGKLDQFTAGRNGDDVPGYYEGYLYEAKEMTKRLAVRGFEIVPIKEGEVK